jgi:hypothetical protein
MTAWIDRYRLVHEEQYRRLDALLEASEEGGEARREK